MFLFGPRRLGPVGMAFMAYRLWRRLSPAQKAAIREHAGSVASRFRGEAPAVVVPPPPPAEEPESNVTIVKEVVAGDLTSPGTIADPALEERRAQEALQREKESRATQETKFEELRRQQEAERHELAATIDEPPPPVDAAS